MIFIKENGKDGFKHINFYLRFFQESSSPALDCPIQDFVEKFQKTFANQSELPVSTISV
jgi:hypothetical protein